MLRGAKIPLLLVLLLLLPLAQSTARGSGGCSDFRPCHGDGGGNLVVDASCNPAVFFFGPAAVSFRTLARNHCLGEFCPLPLLHPW